MRILILIMIVFLTACESNQKKKSAIDTPFVQEVHQAYPLGDTDGMNNVLTVAADNNGMVWAGTQAGLFRLDKGSGKWSAMINPEDAGPVFDVQIDEQGTVWVAAWNGLYQMNAEKIQKADGIEGAVSRVLVQNNTGIAFGPDGGWKKSENQWHAIDERISGAIRGILPDGQNGYWIASGVGLYHFTASGLVLYQTLEEVISPNLTGLAFAANGDLWVGGTGGVSVHRENKQIARYTAADRLPTIDVQCVARSTDGTMWVGTRKGITKFDGKKQVVRHSRLWLLNDDVRDIAFDQEGTAWIATAAGVSAIKQNTMTLADKEAWFEKIRRTRHVREPGIVEKCELETPGDTSTWRPRDDDNDGQYTSMYLVMESFRYAVTKSEAAKARAKKSFDALKYLQDVTETEGFVARTVVPATWEQMADPNRQVSDREMAIRRVDNPREKRVENMWRLSADGKWRWKGDTSSDEITGHMYGYLFYHDLVADAAEKKRVSDLVCRIVDNIIAGDYNLVDIDGNHTKWAVWSPEMLNNDPDWRAERGINSLEMLSFLKLALHMSGQEKYQQEYKKLLYDHHFIKNIEQVKTLNPAWRTHIDDELLALAFPVLMMHEKDPALQKVYRTAFEEWYDACKNDCSPYFNFMYGAFTGTDPNLDCSMYSLRETPLDLIRWRMDNSSREDLYLTRMPEFEYVQTNQLVPVSERGVIRWDNNPLSAVQGDGGHTESDGVFWLLPYWMGRYYGFIQPGQ